MSRAGTCSYGAGQMGRALLGLRRAAGEPVDGFIDRAAARIGDIDGVPVLTLDAVQANAESRAILALHSPGADTAQIAADLKGRGFGSVDTFWSACADSGWLPDMPFWLEPHFDWRASRESMARARDLLVDDKSRRIYDQQCRLREFGDYGDLDTPTPQDQYIPSDLARWDEPITFVDCGAYDGDTIRTLIGAGYRIASGLALEPDPDNYARLQRTLGGEAPMTALRAGAYSYATTLRFAASGGSGARVTEEGGTTIDVVRLDDVCAEMTPTLIKMDIEGAERAALDGAIETLRRCRPALALSVYHRVDDLWHIPLWLHNLGLGYRFDLRSHAYNGFETVLYGRVAR